MVKSIILSIINRSGILVKRAVAAVPKHDNQPAMTLSLTERWKDVRSPILLYHYDDFKELQGAIHFADGEKGMQNTCIFIVEGSGYEASVMFGLF